MDYRKRKVCQSLSQQRGMMAKLRLAGDEW
jgi:hypothetical protein